MSRFVVILDDYRLPPGKVKPIALVHSENLLLINITKLYVSCTQLINKLRMGHQCILCKSIVSRSNPSLKCNTCQNHSHINCLKDSSDIKNILNNFPNLKWTCDNCNNQANTEPTLSDIMKEIIVIKNSQTKLIESIEFCSKKIDDFELKLNKFSDRIKLIEPLNKERNVIKTQITDFEQRSRSNNIEIIGIPEKPNENLGKILETIGKAINYPITPSDIDTYHRVSQFTYDKTKPKNIIVKFISKWKKDNFLASSKNNKNLKTSDLNFAENNKVYINDHLSPQNKLLLKKNQRNIQKL